MLDTLKNSPDLWDFRAVCYVHFPTIPYIAYGSCKEITIAKKQTKGGSLNSHIPVPRSSRHTQDISQRKSRRLVCHYVSWTSFSYGESSTDVMTGTWRQDISPHRWCSPPVLAQPWTLPTTGCRECVPGLSARASLLLPQGVYSKGLSIVLMTSCLSCSSSADIPT